MEIEFDIIMIISFFKIPYHSQHDKPIKSINNISKETFSASFSRTILISCGIRDAAEAVLAMTPMIVSGCKLVLF